MAEIIKIALLGIAGVLFAIQFRQHRTERRFPAQYGCGWASLEYGLLLQSYKPSFIKRK